MAIIHYPGYITKEELALRKKVQVRAISEHIRKNKVRWARIDGFIFIKDDVAEQAPANISLSSLQWVFRCAHKQNMTSDLLYEQIILGKVTGVVVANRVFVISTEPALLAFLKAGGRK
jgi:hypothetical protein